MLLKTIENLSQVHSSFKSSAPVKKKKKERKGKEKKKKRKERKEKRKESGHRVLQW